MGANFAFWQHYLMKLKSFDSALVLTVFLTLLGSFSASAQDEKVHFDSENPTKEAVKENPKNDQDPGIASESLEVKGQKNFSTVPAQEPILRDSELKHAKTLPKAVEKSVKEEEKAQKEEDPLSFNFFYYIIEKFKLSDIIE
jgi:hypothetical protein